MYVCMCVFVCVCACVTVYVCIFMLVCVYVFMHFGHVYGVNVFLKIGVSFLTPPCVFKTSLVTSKLLVEI